MQTDKFKSVGSHTLSDKRGDGRVVEERVIVTDVSNAKVGKGMAKAPSETPIKVISSEIRTLRDGDNNGGRMVRVVRHTLGRRDSR